MDKIILPPHEWQDCGFMIAQTREGKFQKAGTAQAWMALTPEQQQAVHRACCGHTWTRIDDLIAMQDFENDAQATEKALREAERESEEREKANRDYLTKERERFRSLLLHGSAPTAF